MVACLLWKPKIISLLLNSKQFFLATKTFLKHHSNISVCLRMDNTTVVSHIYNKGGTRSPQLVRLTLELWQWCLQKINSDHRSALPRQTQQCGRQRVQRVLQLQRTANRPTSDPALPKKVQCRSLCVTPNDSPLNLRQLETRLKDYLHSVAIVDLPIPSPSSGRYVSGR